MSTSTKTGGDTPIVISMAPATTLITTIEVTSSTTEAETTSGVTSQPSEVVETTMESAVLTSFNAPLPVSTYMEPTTATIHTENEEISSVLSSVSIPSTASTLQITILPPSPASTALSPNSSQPKPGLGAAASIGLGVSMGVVAFLVIVGVGYAVFGRYLRNTRRNPGRETGVKNGNRWWKGRRTG